MKPLKNNGLTDMRNLINRHKRLAALWAVALVFVLALSPAFAADAPVGMQPELKKFQDQGGTVDFMGHDLGVDGWLIMTPEGQRKYAYTTPEGGLIMGILVDQEGKIRTAEQIKAVQAKQAGQQISMPGAEKSTVSKSERFYAEVEKSGWVALGSSDAPYIYMFMNVTCDHCQAFWNDLRPYVLSGTLQVRFIPFGQKGPNRKAGAALLSVDNPMAAWEAYLKGDTKLLGDDKIADGKMLRLDANTALFRDWKLGGPPLTVYRRPADGKIMILTGRPQNTMLLLADMLPKEQPSEDQAAPNQSHPMDDGSVSTPPAESKP